MALCEKEMPLKERKNDKGNCYKSDMQHANCPSHALRCRNGKKGKWSHGKRKYMCEIHSTFVKIYVVHPNILDLKLQNAK
jgi:hypothetical protein